MTTVPPPTTPQPHLPAAPQPPPVVLILQPPPAVAALAPGTVLEAVVVAATDQPPPPATPAEAARSVVTLRTPAGDVTVRLPVALPEGSVVELQVVRAAPEQVSVRVLTVNDQPAAQALAQLRQAAAETRAAPPQAQPEAPPQTSAPRPTAVVAPGNAWTPAGAVPVTTLGTISGYVVEAPAAVAPPQQPLNLGSQPASAGRLPSP